MGRRPALGKLFLLFSPLIFVAFSSFMLIGFSMYVINLGDGAFKIENVAKAAESVTNVFASQERVLGSTSQRIFFEDARSVVLDKFFESHKAPLSGYGKFMVATAEKYRLPWWLIPAIAMQESNGGKKIPESSFNAWGWAIYGSFTKKFTNWEEAIDRVGRGLREDYFDQGLVEPCDIMVKYTPPSVEKGGPWCKGVEYFKDQLVNFKAI